MTEKSNLVNELTERIMKDPANLVLKLVKRIIELEGTKHHSPTEYANYHNKEWVDGR